MQIPLLIGLRAPMQCGKTTTAEGVKDFMNANDGVVRIASLAAPLKTGLAHMGIKKTVVPDLYREAAQTLGTDIVRKAYPDWWVNLARSRYVKETTYKVILFDDIRFENEVDLMDETIYLYPHGFPLDDDPRRTHESEDLNSTPFSGEITITNYWGKQGDTVMEVARVIQNMIERRANEGV